MIYHICVEMPNEGTFDGYIDIEVPKKVSDYDNVKFMLANYLKKSKKDIIITSLTKVGE